MNNKRIKKVILITFLALGVTTFKNFSVYANENWTKDRIWGNDRFETANKIADEFLKTNSELGLTPDWQGNYIYVDTATNPVDTVILANGFDFPDALCSSPLSKILNAPVLLTHNNTLTDSTKAQIEKMKIKKVAIVGGLAAVSENVENQLKSMGLEVNRIGGIDRYETSYLIAEKVAEGKKIKGATAVGGMIWQDAMIASSAATIKDAPILLVPTSDNDVLPKYKALLQQNNVDITDTDIYGDEKNIDSCILRAMIPNNLNVDRDDEGKLYHTFESELENKYVNSFGILDHAYTFALPYQANANVFLTRGDDFADSLTVSTLAAKKASPIVFGTPVHRGYSKWDEFAECANQETIRLNYHRESKDCEVFCNEVINKIKNTVNRITLVGGEYVMPENSDEIFENVWE